MEEKGLYYPDHLKRLNQETKGLKYDTYWYENKIEEYKRELETEIAAQRA